MRETKRQMSLYSFYDHTGIEKHLARMAERGWLLCGIGQLFWHYRRIEPKKITFSVCYFPQATIYDPRPSEGQEEFYDLCAHAGWTLAGESGQLQVFYHEGEDPTPIDTDPALEVEAIHQSAKKTVLPANFLLVGVAVLNLGLFLWRFWDNPVLTLASGGTLLALVAYTLILVNCTVELCSYFLWRRRARRAAERGEFLPTRSRVWLQRLLLAILLPAGAWCLAGMLRDGLGGLAAVSMLGVIGIIAAVLGVRKLLKGAGVSAKANLRGTLAVCVVLSILFAAAIPWLVVRGMNSRPDPGAEELPLSVADLVEMDPDQYSRWQFRTSSPLLALLQVSDYPRIYGEKTRSLRYDVLVVKVPALYGLCRDHYLGEDSRYAPTDPAPWGAQEAYRYVLDGQTLEYYVLCYPHRVVEITLDWTPTAEQMAAVGEKLGRGPL
ncbi:MAG: DUF2812 domain-containing protein [Oscillospiraceae bacterium]|jgi:hypothetical protein|nr:DUF2812 domain-containing protein [Oscillospiraceae bacterium]